MDDGDAARTAASAGASRPRSAGAGKARPMVEGAGARMRPASARPPWGGGRHKEDLLFAESARNCLVRESMADIERFEAHKAVRLGGQEGYQPRLLNLEPEIETEMHLLADAAYRLELDPSIPPTDDPPTPRPPPPFRSLLRNAPGLAYAEPPPEPGARVSSTKFQRPTSALRRRPISATWSVSSAVSFADRHQTRRPPIPAGKLLYWEVRRPAGLYSSRANAALSANLSNVTAARAKHVADIEPAAHVPDAAVKTVVEVSNWQPHKSFYPAFTKPKELPHPPDIDEEGWKRHVVAVARRKAREEALNNEAELAVQLRASGIRKAHRDRVARAKAVADATERCRMSAAGRAVAARATRGNANAQAATVQQKAHAAKPEQLPSRTKRVSEEDECICVADLPDVVENPEAKFVATHGTTPFIKTELPSGIIDHVDDQPPDEEEYDADASVVRIL